MITTFRSKDSNNIECAYRTASRFDARTQKYFNDRFHAGPVTGKTDPDKARGKQNKRIDELLKKTDELMKRIDKIIYA